MVLKMSMVTTLMCLAISSTMVTHLAMATDYTIGGPAGGWDSVTNLQTWASSQPFSVGDNLIFQYGPNHNVIEVTKTDYDSCQATNAIQTYTDGATTIPLTAPGKRYFICGTPGHCAQGMKVEVNTLVATTTPPPLSETTPLIDEPPTSSPIFGPTLSPLSPFEPSRFGGVILSPSVNGLEPPPLSSSAQVKLLARSTFVLGFAMILILVV